MSKGKITQNKIKKFKELIDQGESKARAAALLGIAQSTGFYMSKGGYTLAGYKEIIGKVSNKRSIAEEIERPTQRSFPKEPVVTPELCRKIKILTLVDGLSVKEISKKLEIGDSTLYVVKQVGYDFKAYKKKTQPQAEKKEEKLDSSSGDLLVEMKKINIRLARQKEQLNSIEELLNNPAIVPVQHKQEEEPKKEKRGFWK